MLITLLPQNGIGNYSAPNHINYRAGCARARSSFSKSTPNYSARARHSQRQIERNFRRGDGKISARPVFDGFIPSGPNVTSMVMTTHVFFFCIPTRRRGHLISTAGRKCSERLGSNKSFLGNSQGEVYVCTPIGKMTCRARVLSARTHAIPRRPMATTCFQEGLRPRTITPRRPRDDATPTRSRHRFWTVSGRLADDQTHEQRVAPRWPDGNKMDPSAPRVAPECPRDGCMIQA